MKKTFSIISIVFLSILAYGAIEPIENPAGSGGAITPSSLSVSGDSTLHQTTVVGGSSLTVTGNTINVGGAKINGDSANSLTVPVASVTVLGAGQIGALGASSGLTVYDTPGSVCILVANNAAPAYSQRYCSDGPDGLGSSATMRFKMGGDIKMVLKDTGILGVGTINPCSTCTVHVVGSINATEAFHPGIKTLAELQATTPQVGDNYTCSDCINTYTLCVGTGPVVFGFREVGTATGCK